MKKDKFLIIFSLVISIILLSFFSVSGCKIIEETSKEEISPTEKSEKDPETETGEDVSNIVEKEEIPEIILISPAEVYEIITNNEEYIILDVRTQEEYSERHLDKALLIPVDELEERIDELPGNKPMIVYCRSGVRSNRAAGILIDNGFTKVYDMGGILGWQEEGLPVIVENNTEEILELQ